LKKETKTGPVNLSLKNGDPFEILFLFLFYIRQHLLASGIEVAEDVELDCYCRDGV
jgi:hypothetical protein